MPSVKPAKKAYVGCRVAKRFGKHAVFEGTVTDVLGKLIIEGKEVHQLHFHIRYDDGDEEDLTWESFEPILIKEKEPQKERTRQHTPQPQADTDTQPAPQSAAEDMTRRNIKRPARFEDDGSDDDVVVVATQPPAARPRLAAPTQPPPASQPAHCSQPAADKENQVPQAAPARKVAPVRSGLEAEDFGSQPPPKRQKRSAGLQERQPKERIDPSLRITPPPGSEAAQAFDSQGGDGFHMRTRGLAGHLYRVTVANFMCHEHFTMDFGPHVTFISGTNGSGKSAVLQALQFCLGVSAAKTGRAGANTNFIRSGCHEAKVAVTLWNTGDDAHRPDTYGQFITIQRKVGRGAGWQMSGERGNIVSRSRDEMLAIVDHLSIDAANPIAVMTQDTTRDFLSGSGEAGDKKQFALFMEATKLAKVREDLAAAEAYIGQTGDALEAEKPKLKKLKEETKELTKSLERLQEVETWREQLQQVTRALAWGQVEEIKEEVATAEEKLAAMGGPQLAAALDAVQGEVQAQEAEVEQQKDSMELFHQDVNELAGEATELQGEHTKARRACTRIQNAVKKLRDSIQDTETQKQMLDESLAESQAEWGAANAAYNANIQQLQQQTEALRYKTDSSLTAYRATEEQFTATIDAEVEAGKALKHRTAQVDECQQQKRQAQAHMGIRLAQFGGASMVELCKKVQRAAGRFHRKPIGPLGAVLALSGPKWSVAVDAAIGKDLSNFVVHDAHDMRLLRALGREAGLGQWLSVTQMNFDLPRHAMAPTRLLPPELLTLLQVLSADGEHAATVTNVLVDIMKCEKIVLCDSPLDAQKAIHAQSVTVVYCQDGAKRYKRRSTLGYVPYRQPRYRRGKLGQDASAFTRDLDEALALAQREVLVAEAHLAKQKGAAEAAKRRMQDARTTLSACRREKDDSQYQLDWAASQPPPASEPAPDADGEDDEEKDSLQAQIAEKVGEIWDLRQSLAEEEARCREAEARERAADAEHRAKKQEIEDMKAANERRLAEMSARLEALTRKQDEVVALADNSTQIEALKEEWQHVRQEKQKQHGRSTGLAEKVCGRQDGLTALEEVKTLAEQSKILVPVPVNLLGLSAARQKLERKVNAQLKEAGGSQPELEVRLKRVQRREGDLRKRMLNVVAAYNVALEGHEARTQAVAEKTKMIIARVKNSFAEKMGRKGHLGSLSISGGKLEMKVRVAGSSEAAGKTTDMKQLSGGERSFSTVALTLAIGEFANCPFRAMDEFDVYCDAMTRTVSLSSLFGFARHCHELQMILITPQDIAAVEEAKKMMCQNENIESVDPRFVHVVRMQPARQNATRS